MPTAQGVPTFYSAKWRDSTEVDPTEIGARTPLILVHGIQSDASIWTNFIQTYRDSAALRDKFKPYVFQYRTATDQMDQTDPETIVGLGKALGDYIQQWNTNPVVGPDFGFSERPVIILAHSMGGLVARSMMSIRSSTGIAGRERVLLLVTLATPHHGTPAANLYYVTPTWAQTAGSIFFNLKPTFALDMSWDCFDLKRYENFCGPFAAVPEDDPKIIAYGAEASVLNPISQYHFPNGYLNGLNIANDGIVPLQSALFSGRSEKGT
jgi:triacylglycerol esterase/lipase EstA (alpha/beta hydrolase family)